MTPNFDAKQNVDLDEWTQGEVTESKRFSSDDEDDVSSPGLGRKKYCVDCGQPIPDGSKYCPSCGREQ